MSVSTTGVVGNYTVSLNNAISGTIVTDVNGKARNTFATNESFIVKVPAKNVSKMSNEFSVSVSANGTINKAYYNAASNSKIQRTLALYPDNSQVNAKTNLNINLKTKVEISKVDVVKAGHHGTNTSSDRSFYEKVNPKYIIITSGYNNKYGFPHQEALENIGDREVHRTDLEDQIIIYFTHLFSIIT